MSRYIDGSRVVYWDNPIGDLTIPGTVTANSIVGGSFVLGPNVSFSSVITSTVSGGRVDFNIGNLSSANVATDLVVGSSIRGATKVTRSITTILGQPVNSYRDLFSLNATSLTDVIEITVVSYNGIQNNNVASKFIIPVGYYQNADTWSECIPFVRANAFSVNLSNEDIAIDVRCGISGQINVRLRRKGTSAFAFAIPYTCTIEYCYMNGFEPVYTQLTAGGIDAPAGIYSGTSISQWAGKVGINCNYPVHPLHVGGAIAATNLLVDGTSSVNVSTGGVRADSINTRLLTASDTVSTINANAGNLRVETENVKSAQISSGTFSSINTGYITATRQDITALSATSVVGQGVSTLYVSTGGIQADAVNARNISTSGLVSSVAINTGALRVETITGRAVANLSSANISSISSAAITADITSSLTGNVGTLNALNGSITTANISTANISSISTASLYATALTAGSQTISSLIAQGVSTPYVSTGGIQADTLNVRNISTSGKVSSIAENVGSLRADTALLRGIATISSAQISSISTNVINTTQAVVGVANVTNVQAQGVSTINISTGNAQAASISTNNISSGVAYIGNLRAPTASITSLLASTANVSSISTAYTYSTRAEVSTLNNIATHGIAYMQTESQLYYYQQVSGAPIVRSPEINPPYYSTTFLNPTGGTFPGASQYAAKFGASNATFNDPLGAGGVVFDYDSFISVTTDYFETAFQTQYDLAFDSGFVLNLNGYVITLEGPSRGDTGSILSPLGATVASFAASSLGGKLGVVRSSNRIVFFTWSGSTYSAIYDSGTTTFSNNSRTLTFAPTYRQPFFQMYFWKEYIFPLKRAVTTLNLSTLNADTVNVTNLGLTSINISSISTTTVDAEATYTNYLSTGYAYSGLMDCGGLYVSASGLPHGWIPGAIWGDSVQSENFYGGNSVVSASRALSTFAQNVFTSTVTALDGHISSLQVSSIGTFNTNQINANSASISSLIVSSILTIPAGDLPRKIIVSTAGIHLVTIPETYNTAKIAIVGGGGGGASGSADAGHGGGGGGSGYISTVHLPGIGGSILRIDNGTGGYAVGDSYIDGIQGNSTFLYVLTSNTVSSRYDSTLIAFAIGGFGGLGNGNYSGGNGYYGGGGGHGVGYPQSGGTGIVANGAAGIASYGGTGGLNKFRNTGQSGSGGGPYGGIGVGYNQFGNSGLLGCGGSGYYGFAATSGAGGAGYASIELS